MTRLLYLLMLGTWLSKGKIQIEYLSEKPSNIQELTFYKKFGTDYIDSPEIILKDLEIELKELAKSKEAQKVEIFILERVESEIPTETQSGRIAYVAVFFKLKNQ